MNRLLRFCLLITVLASLGYTRGAFADPSSNCGIYEIGETDSAATMWGIQPPLCNDFHLVENPALDPPYVNYCQAAGYGFRVVCRPEDITEAECYADASFTFCGTYGSCDNGYRKDTLDNYVYYNYNAAAGLEICVPCNISSSTRTESAGGGTTIKTIITKSYTHADCIGTPDQPAATYACAAGYHINPERGAPTNDTDECDADCSTDETCTSYTDTGTPGYQQATCTTLNTDCTVAATRTIYQCTPNTYLGNAVMTNGVLGGCCENKETCADTWVDDGEGREKKACSRPNANCANEDTSQYKCKTGYEPETAGITDSSLVCKIQCNVGAIACDEYEPVTLNGQSGYEKHLCGTLASDCTRPNTYYEYGCAANYHNKNGKNDETIECEQDCSTNEQIIDCTDFQNSDYCNSVNAPKRDGYVLKQFTETKNADCTVNTRGDWMYSCDGNQNYEGNAVYDANTNQFSGCKIKNNCTAGYYYDPQNTQEGTNVCKECPNTHPYSEPGADNQIQCYKTCPTKYFVDGDRTTDSLGSFTGTSNPEQNTVYYGNDCTYPDDKIECNATGGTCNMGYHLDNTTKNCVENVINTNCGSDELSFFDTDTQEYSQCYIQQSSCDTAGNKTFFSKATCKKTTTPYGICAAARQCSDNETLSTTCTGGTIDGLIFPNGNSQYNDYSECRCTKSNVPLLSGSKQIGTAKITYKFNDNGSLGAVDTTTVTTCVKGYCRPGDTDTTCTETAIGYYSDEDTTPKSMLCKACPVGATTVGTGSTDKSACYYTRNTVFEDDGGTFTIPGTNFSIKWK